MIETKRTLFNGDCIEIINAMEDNFIHLLFTSPPYFNAMSYSQYETYEDYLVFMERFFKAIYPKIAEGRYIVINTSCVITPRASRQTESIRHPIPYDLHHIIQNAGFQFYDDIIWVKPEGAARNRVGIFGQHRKPLMYKPNPTTEHVMVYRKNNGKLIDWNIKQYSQEIIEQSLVGDDFERSDVWIMPPVQSSDHPAPFPLQLASNVVRYYSMAGDLVVDPFMGIGTTGVACRDSNRNFLGIELSKEYYESAKERIENETD